MLTATLLALAAAVLHAGWNFLIKTGEDRTLVGWGQFLFAGLLSVPVLVVLGPPGVEALPYLAGSSAVHVVYLVALVRSSVTCNPDQAWPICLLDPLAALAPA